MEAYFIDDDKKDPEKSPKNPVPRLKLNGDDVDSCFNPIIQSGGEYNLKPRFVVRSPYNI